MARPTSIQYRPRSAIPIAVSTKDGGAGVCGKEVPGPMKFPKENGLTPTPTVATTVLEEVSITETLLLIALTTYTRVPAGFTAIPEAKSPPEPIVAMIVFEDVSITETPDNPAT
jgi:hypothetical protein